MLTSKLQKITFISFFPILLCLWLDSSSASAAPLYVVEKAGGIKVFTNRKPNDASYRVFSPRGTSRSHRIIRAGKFSWSSAGLNYNYIPKSTDYDLVLRETAVRYGVEPALVKAVAQVESGFNPRATSPMGAMGLMQLMPGTAERFGVEDPYEPQSNVDGGVRYLRFLLDRYEGNRVFALAAYNSGEGTVDREGGVPAIEETKLYVRNVLKVRDLYVCVNEGLDKC